MKLLRQLTADKIAGKRCLLRLNLDIKDPAADSFRLEAVMPTLYFLLGKGALLTIIGHRGRPQGVDETLSVKPVVEIFSREVGQPLAWIENVRFDPREQVNDPVFAKELSGRGDFFVNEDFATSHHTGASFVAITNYLPAYAGLRFEEELHILTQVSESADRPLIFVVGGGKVEDKIEVIQQFAGRADKFLMGSAYIDTIRPELRVPNVILPPDWVTDEQGKKLDVGPKTISQFEPILASAKTIIWSGPLGRFEDERFRPGSIAIANAIAHTKAFSVVGGGDTTDLLRMIGLERSFSFVSTGGGAMLAMLSGKEMPGVKALEENMLSL